MMIGMKSLPRDIQKLANAQGWEEDELLGLFAAFLMENSLEEDLLEFLQDEAEKLGGADVDDHDEEDPDADD